MQVEVREHRRDDPALRGSRAGMEHLSIGLQYPGLEPSSDQLHKGAVVETPAVSCHR